MTRGPGRNGSGDRWSEDLGPRNRWLDRFGGSGSEQSCWTAAAGSRLRLFVERYDEAFGLLNLSLKVSRVEFGAPDRFVDGS